MTRVLNTRSSKRKIFASQEVPDECKENQPPITSKNKSSRSNKKLLRNDSVASKSSSYDLKENISLAAAKLVSPIKTRLDRKISSKTHHKSDVKVLCDKTNCVNVEGPIRNDSCFHASKSVEGDKENFTITAQITNSLKCPVREKEVNHIPVYKASGPPGLVKENQTSFVQSDDVYEFEVDENEEPVKAKKRKRRAPAKKKTGENALTINNIKYSSTESLISLPERSNQRKKINKKPTKKFDAKNPPNKTNADDKYSSCESLISHHKEELVRPNLQLKNNNNITLSSEPVTNKRDEVKSAHSTTDILHVRNEGRIGCDLSVLMEESGSKAGCDSLVSVITSNKTLISSAERDPSNYLKDHPPPTNHISVYSPSPSSRNLSLTRLQKNHISTSHRQASKSRVDAVSRISLNESAPHSFNHSAVSSGDFLSSTPMNRGSLSVQNQALDEFDRSFAVDQNRASLFGFDDAEELEVPLISPIKRVADPVVPKRQKAVAWTMFSYGKAKSQPSIQEVIEILKASIPKKNEQVDVKVASDCSFDHNTSSSPAKHDEQVEANFKKPPRRSYERQRRIIDHREEEEEEEGNEGTRKKPLQDPERQKPVCRRYKGNTAKLSATKKSTTATRKQKKTKEELELEKLAAQMNAQFQVVDNVSLVVE